MEHPRDDYPTVHDLVAVFPGGAAAREVAERLIGIGVPPDAVRVETPAARVEALKAEMRDEADNTIVGPGSVGPFTKEMTKGILRQSFLWGAALAVLGSLLALFDWPASNLPFTSRLAIAVAVGAVTGLTIGFVWGGGSGAMHDPSLDSAAADRGVTLSATVPPSLAAQAVQIIRDAEPIRLDLGTPEGGPVETLASETDRRRRRARH